MADHAKAQRRKEKDEKLAVNETAKIIPDGIKLDNGLKNKSFVTLLSLRLCAFA